VGVLGVVIVVIVGVAIGVTAVAACAVLRRNNLCWAGAETVTSSVGRDEDCASARLAATGVPCCSAAESGAASFVAEVAAASRPWVAVGRAGGRPGAAWPVADLEWLTDTPAESAPVVSAQATPWLVATAMPTPSATTSPLQRAV
jgi:hypothetical protein